jgi:hypothetical protein
MKQLIYLEKDFDREYSKINLRTSQRVLYRIGIPREDIDNMKTYFDIESLGHQELFDLINNKENIIVSYSSYIGGSDFIFLDLMEKVGHLGLTGLSYIDTSGCLPDFLKNDIRNCSNEELERIFLAINSNTVLSYHIDEDEDDPLEKCLKKIQVMWVGDEYDIILNDYEKF